MRVVKIFALSGVLALAATVGHAADRRVEVVNKAGLTLTHFYASAVGANSWEEDVLGRDTVSDGESFTADINDGSGACKFDFKGVFENGATAVKGDVDVCSVSTFTFSQ